MWSSYIEETTYFYENVNMWEVVRKLRRYFPFKFKWVRKKQGHIQGAGTFLQLVKSWTPTPNKMNINKSFMCFIKFSNTALFATETVLLNLA